MDIERPYEVKFEIAGPAAMFTRPDTGSTPISYPVPTLSAAKGMFEAVARFPYANSIAWIQPTRVEVCRPIRYERYVTNYGGPLRKQDQLRNRTSYQLIATILVDVCYRIYAEVRVKKMCRRGKNDPTLKKRHGAETYRLALRDLFDERLQQGETYYTPCLGWKEFVPSYFGPFRERDECGQRIEPLTTGEIHIPAMLISMWEHRHYNPSFCERWIVDGVMSYEHEKPRLEVRNVE